MDSMQAISGLTGAEVPRLPCRAYAPGYSKDLSSLPDKPGAQLVAIAHLDQQPEPYQADRAFHAMLARFTGGISPVALLLAYIDWASHLAAAPQRQMEVAQDALRSARRFFEAALHWFSPNRGPWSLIRPQPQDRRFAGQEWERPPFNLFAQAFLLNDQWWHNATTAYAALHRETR
jgi:polyhydroxyalkanoate synthase subunit PhaC